MPLLVVENTADDAIPSSHLQRIYTAVRSTDKTYKSIRNATHYYVDQPELLANAVRASIHWMRERHLED